MLVPCDGSFKIKLRNRGISLQRKIMLQIHHDHNHDNHDNNQSMESVINDY